MRAASLVTILLVLGACARNPQPQAVTAGDVVFHPMPHEQLSPLNHPRVGHALSVVGGELVAVGGHTTGFLIISSAEYYRHGRWKEIPTLYPHDTPFSLQLKDGRFLVGGGYEDSFGVGQSFGVEAYDARRHRFTPLAITDRKRAHSSALELSDGTLLISGNWYAPDEVETYAPDSVVAAHALQMVAEQRSFPLMLSVAQDSVWVFGGNCTSRGQKLSYVVDVIGGEPFTQEIFAEWEPQSAYERYVPAGEFTIGPWTYLIPARNADGETTALVVGPEGFSRLSMDPIPRESPWGVINYSGTFWVNPATRCAWLMGNDVHGNVFLAELAYGIAMDGGKATVKMHYAGTVPGVPVTQLWEQRLPDGSFVVVGGSYSSNYEPTASVFRFYPLGKPAGTALLWALLALLLVLICAVIGWQHYRRKGAAAKAADADVSADKDMRVRLLALMEEQQLFRRKGLRIADVATELGTNTTYVSGCLSGQLGTSFHGFVSQYRVRYAQKLMLERPGARLSVISEESGFSNEKTFFRIFKAFTGQTPSEWKNAQLN